MTSNASGATAIATSASNTSLALGAGAAYAITPSIDLTGELIHYNRIGNANTTGQTALNSFNIGMRYHFM